VKKISVSEIETFLQCRRKWYYTHVEGYSPPSNRHLVLGTLFHENMAARAAKKPIPNRLNASMEPEWPTLSQISSSWDYDDKWGTIVSIESPLTVPLQVFAERLGYDKDFFDPDTLLVGTPDFITEDRDGYWLHQHKTLGKGRSKPDLMERVRLSLHESFYHWLVDYHHGPCLGTVLYIASKQLKARGNSYDLEDIALVRPRDVVQSGCETVLEVAREMALKPSYRVPASCFNLYGSRCPYYSVCYEGAPLHEAPFTPTPHRYL
jgi:hypothetical protein